MTTLTKNKTITFEATVKMLSKFTAKKPTRPELELIYYDGIGNLYATDSHRLIRLSITYISDFPDTTEPFLYNPKTNEFVEGLNYTTTVSRLIPNNYNTLININNNIKDIESVAKEIKKAVSKEKNSPITFNFTDIETGVNGVVKTEQKYNEKVCSSILNSVRVNSGENVRVTVNVKYLLDGITTMKKLTKLSNDNIELKIISNMRPVVFSQLDIFDILLMPIRLV